MSTLYRDSGTVWTAMTQSTDAKLRLIAYAFALASVATALVISFTVTPEQIESGSIVLSPPCPTKRFFGFECASCGMTRAFTALGHGRLRDALAYNRGSPLVFVAVWVAGVLALRSAIRAARDLRTAQPKRLPSSAQSDSSSR